VRLQHPYDHQGYIGSFDDGTMYPIPRWRTPPNQSLMQRFPSLKSLSLTGIDRSERVAKYLEDGARGRRNASDHSFRYSEIVESDDDEGTY
jgi:hypothetical protein